MTPVPKDAERHWDVNLILFTVDHVLVYVKIAADGVDSNEVALTGMAKCVVPR